MPLCPSLCLQESVGDTGGVEEGPGTAQLWEGEQHRVTAARRHLGEDECECSGAGLQQHGEGRAGGCAGPGELTLLQTGILPSAGLCFPSHQHSLLRNTSALHPT